MGIYEESKIEGFYNIQKITVKISGIIGQEALRQISSSNTKIFSP